MQMQIQIQMQIHMERRRRSDEREDGGELWSEIQMQNVEMQFRVKYNSKYFRFFKKNTHTIEGKIQFKVKFISRSNTSFGQIQF